MDDYGVDRLMDRVMSRLSAVGGGLMEQRHRTLTIAGIDRTLNLLGRTLNINDKIPGRSTCSFNIYSKTIISLQEGQEVIIEDGVNRIFAGEIKKYQEDLQAGVYYYQITCSDYNAILDRSFVGYSF